VARGVILLDQLSAEQREKRVAHPAATIQVKARDLSRQISHPLASLRARRSNPAPGSRTPVRDIASLRSQ
jgi:hypothetical protein